MKPLEDIFSKEKTENKNQIKTKIIVDTREKQSLVAANLIENGAEIIFEKLEVGDYLIKDIIIERKTFSDFISSMINKRIFSQLQDLKKYPKNFLIIEGFSYDYDKIKIHENAIKGMLLSCILEFKIPIIFTKNEKDTSKFLILLAKKQEKANTQLSIRPLKTAKTKIEQKQFILEGFPEIGPTTAKKLISSFSNLKEIFNANEEQLKSAGLNKEKTEKFLGLLNN